MFTAADVTTWRISWERHDFFKKKNLKRNSNVTIESFQTCLIHMLLKRLELQSAVLQIYLDNCRILFWGSIMKGSDDDWMSCFADYQNGRSKPFNGDIFLKYYSATEAVLATKSLWDIFLGHPTHSLTLQQSTCNYAFYVFASYCDQHHTKVSNSISEIS